MADIQIPTTGPLPGLTMLNDVNAALAGDATLQAAAGWPTAASLGLASLAGVVAHNTSTGQIGVRDQADTTWVAIGTIDEISKQFTPAQLGSAGMRDAASFLLGAAAMPAFAASTALTAAQAGQLIFFIGSSPATFTLPSAAAAPKGYCPFVITNQGTASLDVVAPAGEATDLVNSFLPPGKSLAVVNDGGTWWRTVFNDAGYNEAGEVSYFAMASPPAGWLAANGAAVSRTGYANLFAAIGTTFGTGDGSTTFSLPDLRGVFVRGYDNGRGLDPDRAGAFGTYEADAVVSHSHVLDGAFGNWFGTSGSTIYGSGAGLGIENAPTTAFGGTETRPKNVDLLACIKY